MPELEAKLEERCSQMIKNYGGLALKLAPLGAAGFPDRTVMHAGRVFFIEFKREKVGRDALLQSQWVEILGNLGFTVYRVSSMQEFLAVATQEFVQ